MKSLYATTVEQIQERTDASVIEVETDVDLYYAMALSMYNMIEINNRIGKHTVFILPVGPVFQYRRFITLLNSRPLDLSDLHLFFMDEYLVDGEDRWISEESPLSFRGFIEKELILPMPEKFGLNKQQIHFPDPADPSAYDSLIEDLGGVDLCHAGVGIVGHVAFNEPIPKEDISSDDFVALPTRIVSLTPQTITINANTALRGAYDEIPRRAVTVGMKQILKAGSIRLFFNRPWQSAVFRKALLLDPTSEFPVTFLRDHPDVAYVVTPIVGSMPEFELK